MSNCAKCGKFHKLKGSSWAMRYDFVAMEAIEEITVCKQCTEKYGPALSNAKPHDGNMKPYQGIHS